MWVYYVSAVFLSLLQDVFCACPNEVGPFRRVGQTQYFVAHDKSREDFVNFTDAKALCEENNMNMAIIKTQVARAILGRSLEKMVKEEQLQDTWYWLDAEYLDKSEGYYWKGNKKDPVKISDFLYRHPRPTGLGSYISYLNKYNITADVKQCITVALPWPGQWQQKGGFYGNQLIFDEKPCSSVQKRHAICQWKDKACNPDIKDPYMLSETKSVYDYFENGHFIAGNRTYIINWGRRTFKEAVEHCAKIGLVPMEPGKQDVNLIPFVKLWSREFTVTQFWTGLKYDVALGKFFDMQDKEVKNVKRVKFSEGKIIKRSHKNDTRFCVALSLSYEFKTQSGCLDPSSCSCSWSFLDYIPANCNNYLATICQHADHNERNFEWKKSYISNLGTALQELSTTSEFGWLGNNNLIRSNYKQPYGIFWCPEGYRLLREQNLGELELSKKPRPVLENQTYFYDFEESYWFLDRYYGFSIKNGDKCPLSLYVPKYKRRETKNVDCNEYHHYACERIMGFSEPSPQVSTKQPTVSWNEGPQGRVFPLVTNTSVEVEDGKCILKTNVKIQLLYVMDTEAQRRYAAHPTQYFTEVAVKLATLVLESHPDSMFAVVSYENFKRKCYSRNLNFTSDINELANVNLTEFVSKDPNYFESSVHAMAMGLTDPNIGWVEGHVDPRDNKRVVKIVYLLADHSSLCPPEKNRTAFVGDGTDVCNSTNPVTRKPIEKIPRERRIHVMGFFSSEQARDFTRKDYLGEVETYKYDNELWVTENTFRTRFVPIGYGLILWFLHNCVFKDPEGNNTLGY